MRRSMMPYFLVLVSACSPGGGSAGNDVAAANGAAMADTARGAAPATSAAAREAQRIVVRYMALLEQREFAKARQFWGHGGADSGGDAAAFAKAFARYDVYTPVVGAPSDIRVADGQQFVTVTVKVHARVAASGKILDQEGPVMLRRAIAPAANNPESGRWTIWGADIRVRH